ncbi:DsrE family protein [Roseivirga sp.]|uniref:DsrE family protein n=1 Tax=Roseivirga sp. TaxID=1964215 RepID=UPI003B8E03DC
MKHLLTAILLALGLSITHAQETVYPVIQGYGVIKVVPFETAKPNPNVEYKLLREHYQGYEDKTKLYGALNYTARIINAHAYAGVPEENLKMAVVVFSGATALVLNNKEYNERFGVNNPNSDLINQLTKAGVEIIVCGQSMMNQKILPEHVHEGVSMAVSRITASSNLLNKGYKIF